jgi:isopenicillin-N epimerase
MRELGLAAVRAWDHDLAWRGAHHLAARWGTRFEPPESMTGSMATVPLPERFAATREAAQALRDALLYEDGIEVALHPWRDRLWARISAQVYNEIDDVERLATAVLARV